jgi:hypothetical protein
VKRCSRCAEKKPLAEFGTSTRDGRQAYCKPCKQADGIERRYGITMVQYEQALEWQGGRCAICLNRPRSRKLAVDHDHKTGAVRGLLCSRCNHRMLGAAREDPEVLRRAADYLEDPPFPLMLRWGDIPHLE